MYHIQGYPPYHQFLGQEGSVPRMETQIPSIDVIETKGEVIYIIDVPGADSNMINVDINNDTLMVEGTVDYGLGTEEINYLYRERHHNSSYKRIMFIPPEVQKEQAQANVANGILTVRFPKINEGRRLNINQHHQSQPQSSQQMAYQQHNNYS
ncbi:Hsp20/alpha crystallin family protein [Candidatus Contubernalis alkaliaceticus]|uniref:Hsp20/alpha crystallin family protein n=1 Tax=Candidatus Contubernalis alkaliaceticus TaxID=338645 RepID=UPI001F4C3F80|nr:Hsp20/alpha crystallin family protein [Candidatus Contubernalis alkalaceticus]UNC91931.1 Hsp20/alpha crystallin family protein [Candidatus Contubernalis alkalaceticus]